MFLHFSNFHMHSPTAARMRIWNLNLEVNSPSPESKHHSVHLKELYCGMLRPSCSKDKSWPLPWSPVQKLEKKKKDVENTLKRLYPAKHSRDVSGHLKEQALSRENSPLRSWVSTPKENLPHDTVSHRQKCCFISLLPSACPWPVTENPTIRRKYRTFWRKQKSSGSSPSFHQCIKYNDTNLSFDQEDTNCWTAANVLYSTLTSSLKAKAYCSSQSFFQLRNITLHRIWQQLVHN